ncbi:MAG TPA: plastocyanin/azurin family copper-binding protein [Symbiobacteriaceae bacterium]|jgi:uncharacterized cupredoxin-like copper-binding protein|nr:plastocyanin/azurin family copper-binding protein [Symbiobacteriaceae bacterium]
MKMWVKVALATAGAAAIAGCSSKTAGPAAVITLKTEGYAFDQKELKLEKGKTYELVLDNKDVQLHDFSIDKIAVKAEHGNDDHGHDMSGKQPDLHVAADAGKSGKITFTPTASGTFDFYCTVAGHKEAGMVGKMIVK